MTCQKRLGTPRKPFAASCPSSARRRTAAAVMRASARARARRSRLPSCGRSSRAPRAPRRPRRRACACAAEAASRAFSRASSRSACRFAFAALREACRAASASRRVSVRRRSIEASVSFSFSSAFARASVAVAAFFSRSSRIEPSGLKTHARRTAYVAQKRTMMISRERSGSCMSVRRASLPARVGTSRNGLERGGGDGPETRAGRRVISQRGPWVKPRALQPRPFPRSSLACHDRPAQPMPPTQKLIDRLIMSLEGADRLWDEKTAALRPGELACRPGCFGCCVGLFAIGLPEALALRHAVAELPDGARAARPRPRDARRRAQRRDVSRRRGGGRPRPREKRRGRGRRGSSTRAPRPAPRSSFPPAGARSTRRAPRRAARTASPSARATRRSSPPAS